MQCCALKPGSTVWVNDGSRLCGAAEQLDAHRSVTHATGAACFSRFGKNSRSISATGSGLLKR